VHPVSRMAARDGKRATGLPPRRCPIASPKGVATPPGPAVRKRSRYGSPGRRVHSGRKGRESRIESVGHTIVVSQEPEVEGLTTGRKATAAKPRPQSHGRKATAAKPRPQSHGRKARACKCAIREVKYLWGGGSSLYGRGAKSRDSISR
jgi:hypothetical protein